MIADMRRRRKALATRILEVMKEETEKEMELAYREFGEWQQLKITEIFVNAVNDFYSAYTPMFYVRTDGLYDVLDIKTDKRGVVKYDSVDDLLEPSYMHKDRNGGDLYNKVFVSGFHGGATGTDWRGETADSPSYRTLVSTRDGRLFYPRWGGYAAWSTPPYEIFDEKLTEAESGVIFKQFKDVSDKHNTIAMERVVKRLPAINAEIMG
jgi:hypothetical protein